MKTKSGKDIADKSGNSANKNQHVRRLFNDYDNYHVNYYDYHISYLLTYRKYPSISMGSALTKFVETLDYSKVTQSYFLTPHISSLITSLLIINSSYVKC